MASVGKKIRRENIDFEPFYEEIIEGIEAAMARNMPDTELTFGFCDSCQSLHGGVVREDGNQADVYFRFDLPPSAWRKITRN